MFLLVSQFKKKKVDLDWFSLYGDLIWRSLCGED